MTSSSVGGVEGVGMEGGPGVAIAVPVLVIVCPALNPEAEG